MMTRLTVHTMVGTIPWATTVLGTLAALGLAVLAGCSTPVSTKPPAGDAAAPSGAGTPAPGAVGSDDAVNSQASSSPAPTQVPNVEEYRLWALGILGAFTAQTEQLGGMMVDVTRNPSLLGDMAFKVEAGVAVGLAKARADEVAAAAAAPPAAAAVHADLVRMAEDVAAIAARYNEALAVSDEAALRDAQGKLEAVVAGVPNVKRAIEALGAGE